MYQRVDAAHTRRVKMALVGLLSLSLSVSGCALARDTQHVLFLARRTTKLEPKYFPYIRNERLTLLQNRRLAKRVWREEIAPKFAASSDYAAGFIDGFADYLHRGGSGEPPLVPPRGYWGFPFQSEAGKAAIHDWYAGFRHGAADCKARGLRELVVVPSSLFAEPGITTHTGEREERFETPSTDLPLNVPVDLLSDVTPKLNMASSLGSLASAGATDEAATTGLRDEPLDMNSAASLDYAPQRVQARMVEGEATSIMPSPVVVPVTPVTFGEIGQDMDQPGKDRTTRRNSIRAEESEVVRPSDASIGSHTRWRMWE